MTAGWLGGYALEGTIGRGGAGVVHRARDPRDGRPVALKVLLAARGAGATERRRFAREVDALARLEHPNVVRVLGAGEDQGAPFLALELLEGGSLEERLTRHGPLDPREAAEVALALAGALQAAHARGLVHRDLKPGNVLFDRHGTPKLTDFGLVRDLDPSRSRLSQTGQALGTPGFWAPEQVTGDHARIGPTTDVYGLGALLFAALTGRPPFVGATAFEVAVATTSQAPTAPSALRPGVPRALDEVCLTCLAKDPGARYADCGALATDLRAFLGGGAAALEDEPEEDEVDAGGAPRRRSPGLVVGVLAGGVLAGGALALGALALGALGPRDARAPERGPAGPDLTRGAPAPPGAGAPGAGGRPEGGAAAPGRSRGGPGAGPAGVAAAPPRSPARPATGAPGVGGPALAAAPDAPGPSSPAPARAQTGAERSDGPLALDEARAAAHARARAHLERGEHAAARAQLDAALELGPPTAALLADRGRTRAATGDRAGALDDYTAALALDPRDARTFVDRALVRGQTNDPAGAVADYTAALALDPRHVVAWGYRGNARIRQGDRRGAIADWTAALELDPRLTYALYNRGLARLDLGEHELAVADLTAALEAGHPRAADVLATRGDALRARGDGGAAARDYARALELAPAHARAAELRAFVEAHAGP